MLITTLPVEADGCIAVAAAHTNPAGVIIKIERIDDGQKRSFWADVQLTPARLREMLDALEPNTKGTS